MPTTYPCLLLDDETVTDTVDAKFEFSFVDQAEKQAPAYIRATETYSFLKRGRWGSLCFIKRDVLEQSKHLMDDCFTIRCDILVTKGPACTAPFVVVPPSDMQQNFSDLLWNQEGADVVFEVGGKTFPAHRCILAAGSTVFKALLFGPAAHVAKSSTIRIHNVEANIFKALLAFIYTDSFPEVMDDGEGDQDEDEEEMEDDDEGDQNDDGEDMEYDLEGDSDEDGEHMECDLEVDSDEDEEDMEDDDEGDQDEDGEDMEYDLEADSDEDGDLLEDDIEGDQEEDDEIEDESEGDQEEDGEEIEDEVEGDQGEEDDKEESEAKRVMLQSLLVAAEKYNLQRLKLISGDKLCSYMDASTVTVLLVLAEQSRCRGLKQACLEFLKSPENLKNVMATDGLEQITRICPSVLKELLAKFASSV
ncbi:hypothetical protein PR202_ga21964 [Eleusine coracana subsp. coracana]|uniref:BTB domain-containing protein n=1 Tax=Eleusine coracana subsp. coracana TaxID=191504 RepID=A0AAV5D2N9_ELECO|nr:hypothetical protein QOZ80_9AG0683000 [Eleusine coracana subsp. coracana]GJN04417.1 hypothetical protein PR202_ga21964 [Eleusine coracana subsp. coracana]